MVNPVLIIISVVLFVLVVISAVYFLVYFQHEEDKNTAIFPKVVVVSTKKFFFNQLKFIFQIFSFTTICVSILMLPLDVGNSRTNGGFPMQTLWYIVLITLAVLAVIVIPFSIFYYEAEDPDKG
jgi:LMBR1 domain-containing protein 1